MAKPLILVDSHPVIKSLCDEFTELRMQDKTTIEFLYKQIENAKAASTKQYLDIWDRVQNVLLEENVLSKPTDGTAVDQVMWYRKLLVERKEKPCNVKDQAGQWWDESIGVDERLVL